MSTSSILKQRTKKKQEIEEDLRDVKIKLVDGFGDSELPVEEQTDKT